MVTADTQPCSRRAAVDVWVVCSAAKWGLVPELHRAFVHTHRPCLEFLKIQLYVLRSKKKTEKELKQYECFFLQWYSCIM